MTILTPKSAKGNEPDYTFIYLPGLAEKADNYSDMYINPKKDIRFKEQNAKYNISPF